MPRCQPNKCETRSRAGNNLLASLVILAQRRREWKEAQRNPDSAHLARILRVFVVIATLDWSRRHEDMKYSPSCQSRQPRALRCIPFQSRQGHAGPWVNRCIAGTKDRRIPGAPAHEMMLSAQCVSRGITYCQLNSPLRLHFPSAPLRQKNRYAYHAVTRAHASLGIAQPHGKQRARQNG